MEDASGEIRAKALSLKAALEKPGVTYAICLIGRYSALMEPLARKLQSVGVSVPSVKKSYCFSSERPRSRPGELQHSCI